MTALDDLLRANATYAAGFAAIEDGKPQRRLAVLTCMDARIDPAASFGLAPGDAHVLRNAGGLPTEDALRSLAISQRALGTTQIAVVLHTRCGMTGFDDAKFRAELVESGATPTWDVPGFDDVQAAARQATATVRECPWLPHRENVRGFVFDVTTGALTEV